MPRGRSTLDLRDCRKSNPPKYPWDPDYKQISSSQCKRSCHARRSSNYNARHKIRSRTKKSKLGPLGLKSAGRSKIDCKSKAKRHSCCYESMANKSTCHLGKLSGLFKHFNPMNRTLRCKLNDKSGCSRPCRYKSCNNYHGLRSIKSNCSGFTVVAKNNGNRCYCSYCINLKDSVPDHCKTYKKKDFSYGSLQHRHHSLHSKSKRLKTNKFDSVKKSSPLVWSDSSGDVDPALTRSASLTSLWTPDLSSRMARRSVSDIHVRHFDEPRGSFEMERRRQTMFPTSIAPSRKYDSDTYNYARRSTASRSPLYTRTWKAADYPRRSVRFKPQTPLKSLRNITFNNGQSKNIATYKSPYQCGSHCESKCFHAACAEKSHYLSSHRDTLAKSSGLKQGNIKKHKSGHNKIRGPHSLSQEESCESSLTSSSLQSNISSTGKYIDVSDTEQRDLPEATGQEVRWARMTNKDQKEKYQGDDGQEGDKRNRKEIKVPMEENRQKHKSEKDQKDDNHEKDKRDRKDKNQKVKNEGNKDQEGEKNKQRDKYQGDGKAEESVNISQIKESADNSSLNSFIIDLKIHDKNPGPTRKKIVHFVRRKNADKPSTVRGKKLKTSEFRKEMAARRENVIKAKEESLRKKSSMVASWSVRRRNDGKKVVKISTRRISRSTSQSN